MFSTLVANLLLCVEFYQQQAISPVASRENQAYSPQQVLRATAFNNSPEADNNIYNTCNS